MDNKYCKDCPFMKDYYVGSLSKPTISERCFWALKKPVSVKPNECYVFNVGKIVIRKIMEECNG